MEGIDRTALAPADAARVHESDEPETTPLTSTVDDAERAAAFDAPSTAARSGHVSASATSDAARDAAARTRAHELAAASARQGGVPASEPKPEHSRGVAAVFAGLLLAMFVSTLSETVTATALPTIVGDLGGVDHMQWVTTAYILASTVMMPIYGKLGDLFGRKYLFIIALSIFIVGSATCGLAPSMDGLIAGRAVEGLGGGGLIILAQATIADIIPPRQRGKYMGLMGSVFAVSTVVGPLLGGWFVQVTGWRWLFAFNIPLALLAIAAVAFFLTKPVRRDDRPPIDIGGMMAMAVSVSSLVLATAWCTVTGMFIMLGMMGTISYLPTYFQIVEGLAPEQAGLMTVPMMAGVLITAVGTGFLATKTGRYKWMPIASCAVTAVGFVLLSQLTVGTPLVVTGVFLFVLGFGIGLGQQILVLIVQNEFPHAIVGTATAANNFFRQIGSTLGASLVGALFTSRLTADLAAKLPHVDNINMNRITPDFVQHLDSGTRAIITSAYSDALVPIFLYVVPLLVVGFVLMLTLKEHPLATKVNHTGHPGDTV